MTIEDGTAIVLPYAVSIAVADTFTYELNGSYAESNGGPSLVPYGGTLVANGYYFGVNEGLSLSGTGIFEASGDLLGWWRRRQKIAWRSNRVGSAE